MGEEGGVGGGQPEMGYTFKWIIWGICKSKKTEEVLVIGPDKPRVPKRHLTNTGVIIRPILLI